MCVSFRGLGQAAVAAMLDDLRQEIVDAWDEGWIPRFLSVDDQTYRALVAIKLRELQRGQRLTVLGLPVTSVGSEPRQQGVAPLSVDRYAAG
jgi:hypothetical protein